MDRQTNYKQHEVKIDGANLEDLTYMDWFNLLFLNTPVWDPWDFRDEERYLIELSKFELLIGERRLARLLKVDEKTLRSWFRQNSFPKLNGHFPKRVYLVAESWICFNECFNFNLHKIKKWLFTPTIIRPGHKEKPVDHMIDSLEVHYPEFLKRANIKFIRHYERVH